MALRFRVTPATAGTSTVDVTSPAGCAWTAVSNNTSWLTVTGGASDSGDGTVSFSATANASSINDGAAAVVLSSNRGSSGGLAAFHMETWPEGYHDCELASGGTRFDFHKDHNRFGENAVFRMDGKAAYRLAAKVIG